MVYNVGYRSISSIFRKEFRFQKGVCIMFCKKCGKALYDDCNFCHHCGEQQPAKKEEEKKEPEPDPTDATLLFAILILVAIGFYFLYVTGHIH